MKKFYFLLIIILITNNCLFAQNEIPIMSFPFNGNTLDESGNSNNAINYGAILTADRFGNANSAYYFDGIDDYMQIAPVTDLSNTIDFAISLWFYHNSWDNPQNNNSERQYIFDAHSSSSTASNNNTLFEQGYGVTIDYNFSDMSEKLYLFDMYEDDAPFKYFDANSPEIYFSNSWHFITYQKNGLQYELFIDGILVSIVPTSNAATPSNQIKDMMHNLYIGTFAGNNPMYYFNSYNFNGKIDDINIFDKALSKDQITELYQETIDPNITVPITSTITGTVRTHLGVCNHGRVLLFECENVGIESRYSTALLEDGTYTFDNIQSGIYILYVIPEDDFQDGYIPTYSGDEVKWTNTSLIVVSERGMNFDITLHNTNAQYSGCHDIRGNISHAERLGTSQEFKEEILESQDCVVLLYKNGVIICATNPDTNGDYVFTNLVEGTYEISYEFAGVVYKTETVEVSANGVSFISDKISIWPNPTKGEINIKQEEKIDIVKIYAENGQEQLLFNNSISNEMKIDITNLKSGIYFIRINKNTVIKVIKK